MQLLNEILKKGYAIADGAMGTQLFAAGLQAGDSPELWNIERPEAISSIHDGYLQAGADIILTNTFGCNKFRLQLHQLDQEVWRLNYAAAQLAREATNGLVAQHQRPTIVADSMGPSGNLLEPLGEMTAQDCKMAYAHQSNALAAGGVDMLWIETMSDLAEIEAAIDGAQSATSLPVAVTLSFDTAGKTMMGVAASEAASKLADKGIVALGANCGSELLDTEAAVCGMLEPLPDLPIIFKPNAGIPVWCGADIQYNGTPHTLAAHSKRAHKAGVKIFGGCCGSTPSHTAILASVLKGGNPPIHIPPISAAPSNYCKDLNGSKRSQGRRRARSL